MSGMAEHAAGKAETRRIGVSDSHAERGRPAQNGGPTSMAGMLLELQRAAGNTAVARLVPTQAVIQRDLMIGGAQVTESQIVKRGAYKTRLNEIITTEARAAGFTPEAVRRKLAEMTGAGIHAYDTRREAVLAALGAG